MTIEENVLLGPMTTLGVGGPARYMVTAECVADIGEAVEFAAERRLPTLVLGGGSNLLISDAGFPGVVIRPLIGSVMAFQEHEGRVSVMVQAGRDWDFFVRETCRRELCGIECLAGIPGLVGGSPVQNIGAYGQEVADTITHVEAWDTIAKSLVRLKASECGFGYRKSIFNTAESGRYVVLHVWFDFGLKRKVELRYEELKRHFEGRTPTPMEVYHAVREIRHGKGMLLVPGEADCRSAGSFFKNPLVDRASFQKIAESSEGAVPHWDAGSGRVKLAAAWLVEQAGFRKGYEMGRAGISSRHTLAVINRGGATSGEILALRDEIVRRVEERFGVRLEQEPVMV